MSQQTVKPNLSRLIKILEQMRPSATTAEENFVNTFLVPLLTSIGGTPEKDKYGNVWVRVDSTEHEVVTLFSCHTDTVHRHEGIQKLAYDNVKYHMFVSDTGRSNCLGADDGTGIWLMLHMIENKIPGLYVFHRDEECGGGGSSFASKNETARFANFKHCVAFDRKGYTDIITHQGGTQTCSSEFALALATHLPGYTASPNGVYTDSKEYRGVIAECTNLSVGYFNQHTTGEYQDVKFAVQLAKRLCEVPWHTLPAVRTPVLESYSWKGGKSKKYNYDYLDDPWYNYIGSGRLENTPSNEPASYNDVLDWVRTSPVFAAQLLYDLEISKRDMQNAERDARTNGNRALVVQRPDDVRKMPTGRQEKIHRQSKRRDKIPSTGTRKPDPQGSGELHTGPDGSIVPTPGANRPADTPTH